MNPMIDKPLEYFSQWIPKRSDLLKTLEAEAQGEQIPIVGPVVGQWLYLMARLHKAQRIIELGTATGYSTIHMALACRQTGGRITTFEINADLAGRARTNIAEAGLDQWVEVRDENGLQAMYVMNEPADMVFMDIEKEDYVNALPACNRLLCSGGLLIADNTGFKDAHAFNRAIHEDPTWESVNIWSFLPGHSPEHDGLCFALKR